MNTPQPQAASCRKHKSNSPYGFKIYPTEIKLISTHVDVLLLICLLVPRNEEASRRSVFDLDRCATTSSPRPTSCFSGAWNDTMMSSSAANEWEITKRKTSRTACESSLDWMYFPSRYYATRSLYFLLMQMCFEPPGIERWSFWLKRMCVPVPTNCRTCTAFYAVVNSIACIIHYWLNLRWWTRNLFDSD